MMKKISFYLRIQLLIMTGLFFVLALVIPSSAQQQDEIFREEVKVTNVEVPVRVFYKGKLMDNLKRADFKLYEDGKLQAINGFFLKRKKIAVPHYELTAEKEKRETVPSRYFALVFNLLDFHRNLEKGLDYIFDKILSQEDQLLVMVNDKIFFYKDLSDKEIIRKNVKSMAIEQGSQTRKEVLDYIKHIERKANDLRHLLQADADMLTRDLAKGKGGGVAPSQRETYIRRFLEDYYYTWTRFKKNYLTPNIDKFYHFSKHLESIKREKWVINFHQLVKFPQIKRFSEPLQELIERLDTSKFHKLNLDLKASRDFPTEDVSKLFYKVNATFHSILIPTPKDIVSQDLEYKEISTAFENFLRDVTEKTGGTLVASANLVSALDTIREKEDIYYMLTYEPEDADKIGKIKVEVTDKAHKYKVVYDKNIRSSYIKDYLAKKEAENPEIKIEQMTFRNKQLILLVNDFLIKKVEKAETGKVDVHIVVEDKDGKVLFDQSKKVSPENKPAAVNIDFAWLGKGKYYILADVQDELTGSSEFEFVQADVGDDKTVLSRVEFMDEEEESGPAVSVPLTGDKELDKYLLGAANYCERLRQEAFHFYCKEKMESILDLSLLAFRPEEQSAFWASVRNRKMSKTERLKSGKRKVRVFVYDYQIISENGRLFERRKLISKKVGSEEEEKELKGKINTFLAERAIFGPMTLLSKERQDKFDFKLLKYDKHNDRRFAVIEATPKDKKVNFAYGKIWVDTENFSVRKIKVDPRSIAGYKQLVQMARQLKARLFLSCEIDYNQVYSDLRFPTRVLIQETYRGGKMILQAKGYKGWERNKTILTYKNYKFFDVGVDVTEENAKK